MASATSGQRTEPERNAAGIASVNVPGLAGPAARYEDLRKGGMYYENDIVVQIGVMFTPAEYMKPQF